MTEIRVLHDEAQFRAHTTVFRRAMHMAPPSDDDWKVVLPSYEPDRVFAAFEGDEIIGTTQSYSSSLVLPGGAVVPHAAISRVGVRADYTRRGVLTALMREQLSTLPDPVATLRASEGRIYGRFGYGLAGRWRTVEIDATRAVIPGEMTGRVRMIDQDTADKLLPELHEVIGVTRPGQIGRWQGWWARARDRGSEAKNSVTIIHSGPGGDDGFLTYTTSEDKNHRCRMSIEDFVWADDDVWRDLWIYAVRLDLVSRIEADIALDEPVSWLFEDPRAVHTKELFDEIWLRLVDVPRMLSARTYGAADAVVLEVRDELLPANEGRYRVSADGAERTDAPADITIPVDLLGAVYFGDTTFSQLAAVKRIEGTRLADADALFAVAQKPYCGTFF